MKINPPAAGVIGFVCLLLLLLVAVIVGPRTASPDPIANELDQLLTKFEADSQYWQQQAGSWDCQTLLEPVEVWLAGDTLVHSTELGRVLGPVIADLGVAETDLGPKINQRVDRFLQLYDNNWEIIKTQLDRCINN